MLHWVATWEHVQLAGNGQSSNLPYTWLGRSIGFDMTRATYVLEIKIRNVVEAEPVSLLDLQFPLLAAKYIRAVYK